MQEATFLILTALADGSQHGYGIIAEVQEISGGRVVTGYSFVPLAKPSDAFPDAIELNEERSRKLKAIFKKFGKAQS